MGLCPSVRSAPRGRANLMRFLRLASSSLHPFYLGFATILSSASGSTEECHLPVEFPVSEIVWDIVVLAVAAAFFLASAAMGMGLEWLQKE
jgi:hypothetical protein